MKEDLASKEWAQTKAAMSDFASAIEHDGTVLLPYQKLFKWFRAQKHYRRGLTFAQTLIEKIPSNAAAGYWEMGRFHELLGQSPGAIKAYRRALTFLPTESEEAPDEGDFRRALEQKIVALELDSPEGDAPRY